MSLRIAKLTWNVPRRRRPRWTMAQWRPHPGTILTWGEEGWYPNAALWWGEKQKGFYFATRLLRFWWSNGNRGIACPIVTTWWAWRKLRGDLLTRDVYIGTVSASFYHSYRSDQKVTLKLTPTNVDRVLSMTFTNADE